MLGLNPKNSYNIYGDNMIKSFKPIVDENSRVLILGSMPGVKSLEKKQYYGNNRNNFWKLIYALFGKKPDIDYNDKLKFLKEHNIARWDVLSTCNREGSSDNLIKNASVNNIKGLLQKYDKIKAVFLNGRTAEKYFVRFVLPEIEPISYFYLPSSSPANARMSFEEKLAVWKNVLTYLN